MTVHRRDVNLPGPAQRPLYFFAEIIADYLALTVKFAIFFLVMKKPYDQMHNILAAKISGGF